jgi:acyl carrier protein
MGSPAASAPDATEARTVPDLGRVVEPPRLATTTDRLRQLWIAVLGENDIGPDADFFDLGGNSLTAVELMSKVRAEFRAEVGVVVLFDHSTLEALAYQIDRRIG